MYTGSKELHIGNNGHLAIAVGVPSRGVDQLLRVDTRGFADPQALLDHTILIPEKAHLGEVTLRTDIESSIGPFRVLPEYRVQYPEAVTQALVDLYAEYNGAFDPLVKANREWDTDYQYAMTGPKGTPANYFVQIDMVGLPDNFLQQSGNYDSAEIREVLRGRIFEIENSLAMYQLLMRIFARDGQPSHFDTRFRASLDTLRQMHGKPIALLAVTDQKYQAMKESEFGKNAEEVLTDAEVMRLSGFDRFFGPEDFKRYLEENGGTCDYLLYARTSDPVAKLRKPGTPVEIPLLEDDKTRRIIKAHAVTFNVDNPAWGPSDRRKINDTKEYLPAMGMAFEAHSLEDLLSMGLVKHMTSGKPYTEYQGERRLSSDFEAYLKSQGINPASVEKGEQALRAKPMKGAYGCYGHLTDMLGDRKFRQELRQNIDRRGPYVLQPELQTPFIINETDGQAYTYIERNFLSTDGQGYRFMGGFRSLMPLTSVEAQNGRNHGSAHTVWGEIK